MATALRTATTNIPAAQRPAVVVSHPAFATSVARLTSKKVGDNSLDTAKVDDVLSLVAEKILTLKVDIDPARIDGLVTTITIQTISELVRDGRNWRKEKEVEARAIADLPEGATDLEKSVAAADAIAAKRAEIRASRVFTVDTFHDYTTNTVAGVDTAIIDDADLDNVGALVQSLWGADITDDKTLKTASRRSTRSKALVAAFVKRQASDADVTLEDMNELSTCTNPFSAWTSDDLSAGAQLLIETPWASACWEDRAEKIGALADLPATEAFDIWFEALSA